MRWEARDDSWRCHQDLLKTGGAWLVGEDHYKEPFLSFRMFPCVLTASEADSVSGHSFLGLGSSVFACQEFGACVYIGVCIGGLCAGDLTL